jgi:hypothetical protein
VALNTSSARLKIRLELAAIGRVMPMIILERLEKVDKLTNPPFFFAISE